MTRKKKRIIAINRESGSGGKYIGARVAEEMGIKCYDKELLAMAMEFGELDSSRFAEAFRAMDEKRPNLAAHRRYQEGNENVTKYMSASDTIFDLQRRMILEIAKNEDAVIIGRCANWILRYEEDVSLLSVFLNAPEEARVKRVVENSGMNESAARRFVRKTDRQRSEYYYHNTRRNWGSFENYSIILNSGLLSEEECVAILCSAFNILPLK